MFDLGREMEEWLKIQGLCGEVKLPQESHKKYIRMQ